MNTQQNFYKGRLFAVRKRLRALTPRPKAIGMGLFTLSLLLGAGMFVKTHGVTYAADTLQSSNYQVITISGTTDGQPINSSFYPIAYSGDGNVILFSSAATNLPNAGSGTVGLYVYNIGNHTVSRVDISTSGVLPNGVPFNGQVAMSETGRYVTFASTATNLIDGATKQQQMIYKRDTQTGTTTYVGGGYSGGLSQDWDYNLGVSNDGRFSLIASRYVANSYPNSYAIDYGDGAGGTYSWTQLAHGNSVEGSHQNTDIVGGISCDGAFVVYQHLYGQVILADMRKGDILRVTAGGGTSTSPIISCNGRYVLYGTDNRTDITPTPAGMNSYYHLARYDRITGQRIYVDSDSTGVISIGRGYDSLSDAPKNMFQASISDAGDVVLNYYDLYDNRHASLKHLSDGSGTLEPIAKDQNGAAVDVASGTITSDGNYIFFMADPYDLGIAPSPAGSQIIRVKTDLQ